MAIVGSMYTHFHENSLNLNRLEATDIAVDFQDIVPQRRDANSILRISVKYCTTYLRTKRGSRYLTK